MSHGQDEKGSPTPHGESTGQQEEQSARQGEPNAGPLRVAHAVDESEAGQRKDKPEPTKDVPLNSFRHGWAGRNITLAAVVGAAGIGVALWINSERKEERRPVMSFVKVEQYAFEPVRGGLFGLSLTHRNSGLTMAKDIVVSSHFDVLCSCDATGGTLETSWSLDMPDTDPVEKGPQLDHEQRFNLPFDDETMLSLFVDPNCRVRFQGTLNYRDDLGPRPPVAFCVVWLKPEVAPSRVNIWRQCDQTEKDQPGVGEPRPTGGPILLVPER